MWHQVRLVPQSRPGVERPAARLGLAGDWHDKGLDT